MLKISRILFSLSVMFLLAHAITPHLHHSQISEAEDLGKHQSAASLFDYLILAFHNDPGTNHLEDFIGKSIDQITDCQAGIITKTNVLDSFTELSYPVPGKDYPPSLDYYWYQESRGPPLS